MNLAYFSFSHPSFGLIFWMATSFSSSHPSFNRFSWMDGMGTSYSLKASNAIVGLPLLSKAAFE